MHVARYQSSFKSWIQQWIRLAKLEHARNCISYTVESAYLQLYMQLSPAVCCGFVQALDVLSMAAQRSKERTCCAYAQVTDIQMWST